jgi:hypothetical protein
MTMRVYEFTNAEEQFDLLTRIVNLTRSQIKDEHLLRDMGTNESGGESTLDFVKRLVDNAFTEIDDWAMERSVGFVDVRVQPKKSTQSVQLTKPSTKKSVSVSRPASVKTVAMRKSPVKPQPKSDRSLDNKSSITEPISLTPRKTIQTIPNQKFKSFTDTNL